MSYVNLINKFKYTIEYKNSILRYRWKFMNISTVLPSNKHMNYWKEIRKESKKKCFEIKVGMIF